MKAGVGKPVEKQAVAEKKAEKTAAPKKAELTDPAGAFVDMETSQIRKVIAERLSYSKQNIPHYYVTISVQVDKLLALRARLNKHSESKISVNDMVMKASAMASLKVPETNSSWQNDYVRQYKNVNMAFAVSTDAGLMAPVLSNINLKGLQ